MCRRVRSRLLAAGLLLWAAAVRADVPAGYGGSVLHVAFDGEGAWTQQSSTSFGTATANAKLSTLLTSAGVTGPVSDTQCTQANDAVLAGLAAQGLDAAAAQSVLGDALAPAAFDAVAQLAEPR
jgi:hypothetical protein